MKDKINNVISFRDFEKEWRPEVQKKTKRSDVALDIINESEENPYFNKVKVGDTITVNGFTGIVQNKNRKYFVLLSADGESEVVMNTDEFTIAGHDVIQFESFKLKEISPKKEKQPKYEVFGKEKEYKSNPNFGFAAVRDEEIKKIGSFSDYSKVIDPNTPKERPILNAGQFIDNDIVKGYINRIEGSDVYVELIDEPMTIKKFKLKDIVKVKKQKDK
jgi:hypothetical protein